MAFEEPRRTRPSGVRITRGSGLAAILAARVRRRRPGQGGEAGETAPVTPDRPLDLSGGAAAALEFGD